MRDKKRALLVKEGSGLDLHGLSFITPLLSAASPSLTELALLH